MNTTIAENDSEAVVCVMQFAKAPRAGCVKTRLLSDYSATVAADIAAELAEKVCAALSRAPKLYRIQLLVDDVRDPFILQLAQRYGRELIPQGEGNLGDRMGRAVAAALRSCRYALVVGSDCLGYDPEYLQQAQAALAQGNDAVLGPALDGGYVLVGFRRFDPGAFEGIAWGSASVLESQRERFAALGYRWKELDMRSDIDTAEDVKAMIHGGFLKIGQIRR